MKPSGYIYTANKIAAIKEAVNNAFTKPLEVTASLITKYDEDPNSNLSSLLKAAGYDPTKYTQLELMVTKVAYYNSSNGNANLGTNMRNYGATQIFTKDQIPAGSLIVQKEGFQYRPEGWTALDVKTAQRPSNVTTQLVVVDEA